MQYLFISLGFILLSTQYCCESSNTNETKCCISMHCNFLIWKQGLSSNICPKSCEYSTFCANVLTNLTQKFENWRLTPSLLLSSGFKIDPNTRNYVREVRNAVFSQVNPTPLKTERKLVAVSQDVLENVLELNATDCQKSKKFLNFASGNQMLEGSIPLAHRYGGHQFGSWADQLGDGRAHMLGEYVNAMGNRWELQLKGSGLTPYSRRGDGRAVLRSSVREFLCSEALHSLGIPTSRAASLIVSDDPVIRDQFYNGNIITERAAVVLRIAPSWFRIGSLEILTEKGEIDLLQHLVDFVISNYFKSEVFSESSDKYIEFYDAVVNRTITTVVKWMSVGFAHGVCNTDNFSLLGITIDFGPFGFVEAYDPDFVPNTSDDEGRYSLIRQPSVAMYNMDKLRQALNPLLGKRQKKKIKKILNSFNERYQEKLMVEFRNKLGLFNKFEQDPNLLAALLYLMQETEADFTMTFRQLGKLKIEEMKKEEIPRTLWALQDLKKHKLFSNWLESYYKRLLENPDFVTDESRMQKMNSVNPRYILRNWMAEQAIRKANENDFSEVQKLLRILSEPFKEQLLAEASGFADRRPPWANELRVSCSS